MKRYKLTPYGKQQLNKIWELIDHLFLTIMCISLVLAFLLKLFTNIL
nr:MAG TPA: HTH-type transcriptional regulator [Caudoviricetes sp.]